MDGHSFTYQKGEKPMKELLRQKLEECIQLAEESAEQFGDTFEENIAPCSTYFIAPNGKRYKLSIEQK